MGPSVEERAEKLLKRVDDLEARMKGGRRPIISSVPERPTEQEVREHYATHTHTHTHKAGAPIA